MRFSRSSPPPKLPAFDPKLRVVRFIATRKNDPERGPMIWMHPSDARFRILTDGELVWVQALSGSQQLAQLVIDDTIAPNTCVLRDIAGVVVSEEVRVNKPDLDTPNRRTYV